MVEHLKEEYREFKASPPGRRFQGRHERRKQQRGNSRLIRLVKLDLGGIILLAGLFFIPAPGPGSLIAVLGLAMLADELPFLARFMDASEVRLRHVAAKASGIFRRLPLPLKSAVVLLAIAVSAGMAYGAWRLWFGS